MTAEDFFALPPAIALRVLFDSLDEETTASLLAREKPEEPRRPKYDAQLHGKSGFAWASESDLRNLNWFRNRSLESAAKGGEWAARDAKMAETLAKWIAWREWYPDAVWSGIRGDEEAIGAPPCGKPRVHARKVNGQRKQAAPAEDDSFDPENY